LDYPTIKSRLRSSYAPALKTRTLQRKYKKKNRRRENIQSGAERQRIRNKRLLPKKKFNMVGAFHTANNSGLDAATGVPALAFGKFVSHTLQNRTHCCGLSPHVNIYNERKDALKRSGALTSVRCRVRYLRFVLLLCLLPDPSPQAYGVMRAVILLRRV
jgi:hypothetical protein